MGLEDLTNFDDDEGNNSSSSSGKKRKYVQPDVDDMEEFFLNRPEEWDIAHDVNAGELVVETEDFAPSVDHIILRCFTTVSKKSKKARSKGSDAIRLVVWDKDVDRPIGGREKTLRIKTWRKNLGDKIDDLMNRQDEVITRCPNCNSTMVRRESEYGEFFGCRRYPQCKGTRNIDD